MSWMIPYNEKNVPEALWEVDCDVQLLSYQPADPSAGINYGYYEQIFLTVDDPQLQVLLDEVAESLVETYYDEIEEGERDQL